MVEYIVAAAFAAMTIGYWLLCRSRSLPLRERASALVAQYIERDDVSEKEAQSAYGTYCSVTKFWFLPLAVIVSIPLVPYVTLIRGDDEPSTPERRKILEACMLAQLVRNPITSVLCLSLIFVWTAIFVTGGLLTRRLTTFPSLSQMLDDMSVISHDRRNHAH